MRRFRSSKARTSPGVSPASALLGLALCALGPFAAKGRLEASTQYVSNPQLAACAAWNDTTNALEAGLLAGHAARERFRKLWPVIAVDALPGPRQGRWQWMFPLPGYDSSCFGESYDVDQYRFLDGPKARGYPGLRLYIRDAGLRGLEDRTGRPEPVVSAMAGLVVASGQSWKAGDPCPWGDYAMVLDQQDGLFFLYGDLGRLRVCPGQLVLKGEVIGWLGRTGRDVRAQDLGTQLRFEVHTFDDGLFYPVYPGRALRTAGHTEWPIPKGIVRPSFRPSRPRPGQARPPF